MAKKPLYIQLEPGAYPKDIDWQAMTPAERGCYHSLIIYLACSDGKLPNDTEKLASLCNTNGETFDNFWKSFDHKFIEKDSHIEHKRINDELKKARNYIKQKSLAGKKGMQRRYNAVTTTIQQKPNNDITKVSKVKVREVKGSKVKSTPIKSFIPPTLQDVVDYAKSRNSSLEPKKFFEYFDVAGWVDSRGTKVRSWKQKFISWESRNGKQTSGTGQRESKESAASGSGVNSLNGNGDFIR